MGNWYLKISLLRNVLYVQFEQCVVFQSALDDFLVKEYSYFKFLVDHMYSDTLCFQTP